ncbi:hypothetical protein AB0B45_46215 [Nonomuraea sp. NPDC049152]|uniref:hypothetical protein n=1 Tax=Nonomuraea sp. NPDC049152 TaxID=3154350 RepID=UPI0033D89B1A
MGLVLAAVVAASSAAPSDRMPDAADWSFGLVGWYGVLLLFDLPLGYLGANLALAVVQAVMADTPGLQSMASMALSAVSVYGFQFAFGLVVHAVPRVAVRASEAAAEEERIRTEDAVADHMHRDHQRRYAALLDTTVPLLVGLGYGSLDPSDQDTRRRCAHEAARMRRLFAESDDVSDRLLHELREAVDPLNICHAFLECTYIPICEIKPSSRWLYALSIRCFISPGTAQGVTDSYGAIYHDEVQERSRDRNSGSFRLHRARDVGSPVRRRRVREPDSRRHVHHR